MTWDTFLYLLRSVMSKGITNPFQHPAEGYPTFFPAAVAAFEFLAAAARAEFVAAQLGALPLQGMRPRKRRGETSLSVSGLLINIRVVTRIALGSSPNADAALGSNKKMASQVGLEERG
jgi:hypothetical protein